MKLVCDIEEFSIWRLEERQGYMLMPGLFLQLANGYWYEMRPSWGTLHRVKYAGPVRRLNELAIRSEELASDGHGT